MDGGTRWRGLLMDVRRADTPLGRSRSGCFSIEGIRILERALRAKAPLEAVLLGESLYADRSARSARLVSDLASHGCRCEIAPDAVLGELTAGRGTGAVVGLVRLPEPRSIRELLGPAGGGRRTVLVGVDVEDPGNVGALVRTALASGAACFMGVGVSDTYHPRAVRTSMGSLFKLPMTRYPSIAPLIEELDRMGFMKVGAVASGGTPLPTLDFGPSDLALFVGGEAFGLSDDLAQTMDALATVPMELGVDSLSVNAAAAVILYEMRRRQG